MKKVICITVATLMATLVAHSADEKAPGKLGFGYQGALYNGNLMNQVSLRYKPAPFGGQLVFGQMKWDSKNGPSSAEVSEWLVQGKGFYNLIDRKNSDFYVGGSIGYSFTEEKITQTDTDTLFFGALAGVEWNFSELPELGFNFEVGYNLAFEEENSALPVSDDEFFHKGTYISMGAHYYF